MGKVGQAGMGGGGRGEGVRKGDRLRERKGDGRDEDRSSEVTWS